MSTEGFLKRFLRGKASAEEVVNRGGEAGDETDYTNPSLVSQFLPSASQEELKEALAYASEQVPSIDGDTGKEVMDRRLGDIADMIQKKIKGGRRQKRTRKLRKNKKTKVYRKRTMKK